MGIDDVFAVIAEGTRRQILENLRDGDKAVGELVVELQVSQPTVSKHLKVLREAGLVSMRAQGQKRYYSLDTAPLALVRQWLAAFDRQADQDHGMPVGTKQQDVANGAEGGTTDTFSGSAGGAPAGAPVADEQDGTADGGTDPELAEAGVLAAAVLAGPDSPSGTDVQRPPIGRTMGRAAERAADLLSQLRRRRDPSS
ncbi:winged helix-turn-helix transcriptional regulator [Arthrobacter sp. NamB2]|uniref:ArsR/SmtB family transcription factor n=1 Tax=Arthrobacter sp. NamB2 TaxID=2576035 RepID=UPI0010C98E45|nr:metalloregulator ArsR/SmtB family transcription factor [Arthrobacter sp. NamB2]TKV26432.1 winged helix-turn-helix transcriptional regulator [Arthrobacter sp. NamB2]